MKKLVNVSAISVTALSILLPVLALAQTVPVNAPPGAGLTGPAIIALLGQVSTFLLAISMIVAIVILAYGGIRWMIAQSDDAVKKAKGIIINGIIGAAIILAIGVILKTMQFIIAQTFF